MDAESLHQKWKSEFEKLEREIEVFRINFVLTKKCNCKIEECSHFEKARHKIFRIKTDCLFRMRLIAGLMTVREVIRA